jgi:hypothetical protein
MLITVELIEEDGLLATFKGRGEADGATTVAGRLSLARYNLRDRNPALADVDERLNAHFRDRLRLLRDELAGCGR